MKADEFVNKMNSIDFLIRDEDINRYGQGYITRRTNSYKINPKPEKTNEIDPLLQLIQNYDVSKVEIGMITMNYKAIEEGDYIFFGKFEVDDLVINRKTKQILLKENRVNHILNDCAEDSYKFLDAIYESARFLASVPIGEDVSEDPNVCKVSFNCGDLAGGKRFVDFYKMLLGCEE